MFFIKYYIYKKNKKRGKPLFLHLIIYSYVKEYRDFFIINIVVIMKILTYFTIFYFFNRFSPQCFAFNKIAPHCNAFNRIYPRYYSVNSVYPINHAFNRVDYTLYSNNEYIDLDGKSNIFANEPKINLVKNKYFNPYSWALFLASISIISLVLLYVNTFAYSIVDSY